MSSTNRGATRSAADLYLTPFDAFIPLIPFLKTLPQPIWEPACGDGRLIDLMRMNNIESAGSDINTNTPQDFLKDDTWRKTILTNPPFSLAQEFCDHAIKYSEHVVMLLRLNFLASKKRRDWWRKNEPSAIFVLSDRPDFTGGGGDSCDYGWFYWGNRHSGIFHL